MKINNRYLIFVFLFLCAPLRAAIVLKADSSAPVDQTFTFTINAHIQNNLANNFYVAADPNSLPGEAREFAISMVERDREFFIPYTPLLVDLNGSPNMPDPLYDKGIAFLALLQGELITSGGFGTRGEHLIAVSADDLQTVYFFESVHKETEKPSESTETQSATDSTESTPSTESTSSNDSQTVGTGYRVKIRAATNNTSNIRNIPDALTGLETSGIVGLVGTQSHALATVKPHAGNFGDPGTGVAEIILGAANQSAVFMVLDALTGLPQSTNKAFPFDRSSDFIKIGNDIISMDDVVDMHWEPGVGRAYIALRVQGGNAPTDGARAIVVVQFTKSDDSAVAPTQPSNNSSESTETESTAAPAEPKITFNKLALGPIAPVSAFDAVPNKIVGAIGADSPVSILKVRSMTTSTGLFYLIVLGGNGAPDDVTQQLYALPLVNGITDDNMAQLNGTIAAKNQVPVSIYQGQPAIQFWGLRKLLEPATQPAQMPTSADKAAQIGAGPVPFGAVQDLYVSRDAVFVTVLDPAGTQQPGTFYSQALFDENGLINAWTQWQRVGGHVNNVFGGAVDPLTADIYSMITVNGQVNTVTRTDWSSGSGDGLAQLSNAFSAALPQICGGIRGLFDLPVNTPGLLDCSVLIGVGNNAIAIGQTGIVQAGALVPVTGAQFKNVSSFENGTITTTLPIGADDPTIVTVSGGLLGEISPMIAAEIAASASQGWIVCGGCRGVAILSDANGNGWDLATGLGPNFAGITAGMSFKEIGDYCFVRKLICDDQFLYVLTNSKLDRIDLNAGNIGLGEIAPVTLAEVERVPGGNPNGTFLDCIISGKCAFIGTSAGLIRVGNNADIRTAQDAQEINWTWVPVPETGGPVYRLIPFSVTGRAQDLCITGGDLYALGANRGKERSQLNRFVVAALDEDEPISDDIILPFPDLFIKDNLSYLVNFGDLRTAFATDGSVFFHSRSREHGVNARVEALPLIQSPPRSGFRFQGPRSATVNAGIFADSFIGAILRDSASGTWLISGDFGLRVNE